MGILTASLITVSAILIAVDVLIGNANQTKISIRVENWSKLIETARLEGLIKGDAIVVSKFFKSKFGNPISKKSVKRVLFASFIITWSLISALPLYRIFIAKKSIDGTYDIYDRLWSPIANGIGNSLWDWVSFGVTLSLISIIVIYFEYRDDRQILANKIKNSTTQKYIEKLFSLNPISFFSFIIIVDLILIILIFCASLQSIYILHDAYYYLSGKHHLIGNINAIKLAINSTVSIFGYDKIFPESFSLNPIAFFILLTAALPSFVHLFIALSFLLSKLFHPLIRKFIALILFRFAEFESSAGKRISLGPLSGAAGVLTVLVGVLSAWRAV